MARPPTIQDVLAGMEVPEARMITEPLPPFRIVFVNQAWTQLTGYPPQEAIARTMQLLQGPGTDPAGISAIKDAAVQGKCVSLDLLCFAKGGRAFRNKLQMSPVIDGKGALAYCLVTMREDAVTESAAASKRSKMAGTSRLLSHFAPAQSKGPNDEGRLAEGASAAEISKAITMLQAEKGGLDDTIVGPQAVKCASTAAGAAVTTSTQLTQTRAGDARPVDSPVDTPALHEHQQPKGVEGQPGAGGAGVASPSSTALVGLPAEVKGPPLTPGSRQRIPPFLTKLYTLMSDEATRDIASWSENGLLVCVHNPVTFAKSLLPRYFKHNKLGSFQQQLNIYDFKRVLGVSYLDARIAWKHPMFQRGRKDLLVHIKPRRAQSSAPSQLHKPSAHTGTEQRTTASGANAGESVIQSRDILGTTLDAQDSTRLREAGEKGDPPPSDPAVEHLAKDLRGVASSLQTLVARTQGLTKAQCQMADLLADVTGRWDDETPSSQLNDDDLLARMTSPGELLLPPSW
mmetsp:Transcript_30279/g.81382  ORF Transcript_30279/g.81382 Transcript_30279/m.81382 type:complete len:515 (-) Transcript_30279:545-2089(-)